ncbi:alpha/beta hydrolase domain-containing protein 17B isoform X3 [Phascolarctos cinereus]
MGRSSPAQTEARVVWDPGHQSVGVLTPGLPSAGSDPLPAFPVPRTPSYAPHSPLPPLSEEAQGPDQRRPGRLSAVAGHPKKRGGGGGGGNNQDQNHDHVHDHDHDHDHAGRKAPEQPLAPEPLLSRRLARSGRREAGPGARGSEEGALGAPDPLLPPHPAPRCCRRRTCLSFLLRTSAPSPQPGGKRTRRHRKGSPAAAAADSFPLGGRREIRRVRGVGGGDGRSRFLGRERLSPPSVPSAQPFAEVQMRKLRSRKILSWL